MSKTAIEWVRNPDGTPGETLNPLGWGCYGPGGTPEKPRICSYCYAKRFADRKLSKCDKCNQFVPHWHFERLKLPYRWKKPRTIFWQDMGDLFGDWMWDYDIAKVRQVARDTNRHTHIFLTKNPSRLAAFNPWPANCWVGVSATDQEMVDQAEKHLANVDARIRFMSLEPLLEAVIPPVFDWVIVGAMTGPKPVRLKQYMWFDVVNMIRRSGCSVFVKNNVPWTGPRPQEMPR